MAKRNKAGMERPGKNDALARRVRVGFSWIDGAIFLERSKIKSPPRDDGERAHKR
jgi:hypothetical protein